MMKNDMRDMKAEYERCRVLVEDRLDSFFIGEYPYKMLLESMRYSLLAGGKRVRPVICLKFCEAAGGDMEKALDAACAIEMLHTYSLIHDDLPCMDDDDLRRGMPSNHKEYGVFTATLAGDALQAAAFETLLKSDLPPAIVAEMAQILAEAAGAHGICGGQYLDMREERAELSKIEETHRLKTSALISASARIGVLAAGGAPEIIAAAGQYALSVGLAFQVRDDILDQTATAEEIGKPTGSDMKNDKSTFALILGIDRCEEIIRLETEKAVSALEGRLDDAEFLIWLAKSLAERAG